MVWNERNKRELLMMPLFTLIHPSRGRAEKSYNNFRLWFHRYSGNLNNLEIIVSLDVDDPQLTQYLRMYDPDDVLVGPNKSSVEAINRAAQKASGQILIIVSDDTGCPVSWNNGILNAVNGQRDWILKTQDGIQPYIITMPVMDRPYFERTGNIYDPAFSHMFCDTYMTCVADITGRKLTSDLVFHHDNPGHYGKPIDDINRKNDATWSQGEDTFIRLMKQFSKEDLQKIKDRQMVRWLRNKGVQV